MSSKYGVVQRYVVTRGSGFVASNGLVVFGKQVWFQEGIIYADRAKANRHAELHSAHVEKIQISAYRVGWSQTKNEVPRDGNVAFSQGWDVAACPLPKGTPEAVWWIADWWVANATAFQSHVDADKEQDIG